MLCALPMSVSAQQIFIWQGGTSSNWNVGSNWLTFGPGIFPNSPTDIAIVIPAPNNPQLSLTDITVGSLITTFGSSIQLGGFTLTINSGNITSTTITGGRIVHTGTSTLNIDGSTLTNIVFDKNSSGVTNFQNGNTINFSPGNHIRILAGAGAVQMGVTTGDTFTGNALFINNSSSTLTIGFDGMSTFAGDVNLVQTDIMGGIVFGPGMTSTSTLTSGKLDASGVTNGTLSLGGVIQLNNAVTNTIGSAMGYPHTLDIERSSFAGNLAAKSVNTLTILQSQILGPANTLESPEIDNVRESVFANTTITKGATALMDNAWYGDNTYDGCHIINESNNTLRLNVTTADAFYNQAVFDNTGGGLLWIAAVGATNFDADITLNNTSSVGIIVGNNAAGNLATIAGNIKTTGYSNGPLELSRVDQMAVTPNDTLKSAGLLVRNSRVRGDFSYLGSGGNARFFTSTFDRTNIIRSTNIAEVRQSSFSPVSGTSTSFLKTGNSLNSWYGGNTFGNVTFVNSSTNGNLRLADTNPDTFNGKAAFQQTGANGDLSPCYSANCLFRDTISTVGTAKKIIFGGAAAGNAVIDGNSAQVLQGDAGLEPEFRRLEMNTTGTLQLDIPLIIVTSTTFTNGIILSSSTNPVIYATTATPPMSGSDASHVDGPIRREGTGNFRFVTGDNGKFAPVEIVPTGAFGTFEVQYFNSSFSSMLVDASLDHVSSCEYWDISRPGAGDPVNITMTWDDIRSCGIDDLGALTIAHWDGVTWTNMPVTIMGMLPAGTITVSGVASFSPFTLASTTTANPLPIELLYFDARPNGKVVNLHWATATEQNNDFFSIERSRDGLKFEEIMRTPGAGNSTERKDYSEVDTRPLSGLSYYRLRQTDFNGESTVSPVIAVRMEGEDKDIKVFPNPADDYFFVETATDPSSLRVRLLNHVGQTVPLAPQVQAGRLMFPTSNLAAGVYYIEIQQNNGVQSHKVIVR